MGVWSVPVIPTRADHHALVQSRGRCMMISAGWWEALSRSASVNCPFFDRTLGIAEDQPKLRASLRRTAQAAACSWRMRKATLATVQRLQCKVLAMRKQECQRDVDLLTGAKDGRAMAVARIRSRNPGGDVECARFQKHERAVKRQPNRDESCFGHFRSARFHRELVRLRNAHSLQIECCSALKMLTIWRNQTSAPLSPILQLYLA